MFERGTGSMLQIPAAPGRGDKKQIHNCRYKTCSLDTFLERLPSGQRNINMVGVATTCFSCSPPDLNFLVTVFFIFVYM